MKNLGYFLLSHDLLKQSLNLPPETTIVGVLDHDRWTCRVMVTHPDISGYVKLPPGWHTTRRDPEEFELIGETTLIDWGIKENDDTQTRV